MKRILVYVIVVVLAGFFIVRVLRSQPTAAGSPPQGAANAYCSGGACLAIYNVRVGTRCGTSDSVEADYGNVSSSLYLRGYLVFRVPSGANQHTEAGTNDAYLPTDLLKPGQEMKGVQYVCHGTGLVTGIANTGDRTAVHLP